MTRGPSRRGQIPPFIVMDVLREANALATAGRDIIHMDAGQPSTPAPAPVIAAAHAALDGDRLGYTDANGLEPLRVRIARHYRDRYGVAVEPERIVVTTGSSGAFVLLLLAAFDAGARIAVTCPGYPSHRHIVTALGLEPVLVPAREADRFQPTPALIDGIEGALDGLIVASPANPTGAMLDRSALAGLADACRRRGALLISDELYHGIAYGRTAASVLEVAADMVAIGGFSKYFSMTGWRLGWMVLPPELVRTAECLAQNLTVSPPSLPQRAAGAAFDAEDAARANVARYEANRALLIERLPTLGIDRFIKPDGAFYLYAHVGHLTNDSLAFCRRLLHETGISITPGLDFDPIDGAHWVRLSFAGATHDIARALDRLASWPGLLR